MSNEHKYLKKITKGAMIVFLGMFIGKILAYITRIVIARFLGADAYGLFSLASAIIGIAVTISLLGTSSGISRFISYYIGKNDSGMIRAIISSGLKVTIPAAVLVSIVVFLWAESISVYIFNEPRLTPLVMLFSVSVPFSVVINILLQAFRGLQNMKYKVILEDTLKPFLTLLLLLVFLSIGYDIIGAIAAYTIGLIISSVVGFYMLNKIFPFTSKKIKGISAKKDLLSFSWPLIISGYLWMMITWTDTILLGVYRDSVEVGIYNAALNIASVLMIIIIAFTSIFMPVISELYAKKKNKEIIKIHKSVTKWIFVINLSLLLLMILFPDNVIQVLFGNEFVAGSIPLSILAVAFFLRIPGSLSESVLISLGRTKIILFITIIGSVLNVILNILLIPGMGMNGAAIGTGTSFVVMMLIRVYFGRRYLGLTIFNTSYIKALISGIISVGCFYFAIKTLYFSPPWWILGITFPVFLLVYGFIFLILKGFDNNDLMIMKSIVGKTGMELGFVKKNIKRFL